MSLSNAMLERVGVAYRRGYRDGEASTNRGANVRPEFFLPFAERDYRNGYEAGFNDMAWAMWRGQSSVAIAMACMSFDSLGLDFEAGVLARIGLGRQQQCWSPSMRLK